MVEAVSDGRLRVRLSNGHALEVEGGGRYAHRPLRPGERGLATLAPSPTARWRFVASPETPPERAWPKKT